MDVAAMDNHPPACEPDTAAESPGLMPSAGSRQKSTHRLLSLKSPRVEAWKLQLLSEPILTGADAVAPPSCNHPAEAWGMPIAPPRGVPPPPGAMVRGRIGATQAHGGNQHRRLLPLESPGRAPVACGAGENDAAVGAQIARMPVPPLGVAAAGVAAANGAKAECSWTRAEEQLEGHNDSEASAATLVQARNALFQKLQALEAQLRTASGVLKGEKTRAKRLDASLRKAREDGARAEAWYRDELTALNEQQRKLEAQWLGRRGAGSEVEHRAIEIRSSNLALRGELNRLRGDAVNHGEQDGEQGLQGVHQGDEVALSSLQNELAQAERRGDALKEELRRMQSCNQYDSGSPRNRPGSQFSPKDLDVHVRIGFDGFFAYEA